MDKILGAIISPHPPIIVEEIGGFERLKAKKTIESMEEISNIVAKLEPETIVIISPHGNAFRDAMNINGSKVLKGNFNQFGNFSLNFSFENDFDLAKEIYKISNEEEKISILMDEEIKSLYDLDSNLDHGALVPLYFIDKAYKNFKIVSITYGLLDPKKLYNFGKAIKKAAINLNRKTILIASGDLSHKLKKDGPYGFDKMGPIFDEEIEKMVAEERFEDIVNFDEEISVPAAECGLRSFQTMAGFLDNLKTKTKVYSNEGPYGIGYMVAFIENILEDEYINLARKAIEEFVLKDSIYEYKGQNSELLNNRAGAFVSLHKFRELRGCIGTFLPTKENLAKEIVSNAISAATKDPRFMPLNKSELNDIEISVDILSKPEKIKSLDELDVKKYGIIVSKGWRRGLLLPNLDGVDTVEKQIAICKQKAGISQFEDVEIEKFKVRRHEKTD
ncbi:MAG: AmmeMemoRadiSam system protein A [Tissierellia bacterium]|nr:AmmeMemoRadiSam system protein A [Tissierellia bacterium]